MPDLPPTDISHPVNINEDKNTSIIPVTNYSTITFNPIPIGGQQD